MISHRILVVLMTKKKTHHGNDHDLGHDLWDL